MHDSLIRVAALNSRYLGAKSQDKPSHVPPEEEHPVLRDLCEVKLQLREAIPLAREEACRVCDNFTGMSYGTHSLRV